MANIYDGYGNLINVSDVTAFDIPIITGVCPHVYIECEGTNLPDLGSTAVIGSVKFEDGKNRFELYAKMKAQGDQSLNYNQKQINMTLYSDSACKTKQKVIFNDWMPLSKFHVKSHPQDPMQSRNAVVASLLRNLIGTRLPNGAWGFIKAFPVIVHWNGSFVGCYCWTTPQDGKTLNFSKKKELACTNLAYRTSGEYRGDEDETAEMTAKFSALQAIYQNTASLTKAIVEANFYKDSLLQAICAIEFYGIRDTGADNGLFVTWDGVKWSFLPYDFDWTIPGRTLWARSKFLTTDSAIDIVKFLATIEELYSDDVRATYAYLRKNGMDVSTVVNALRDFYHTWNYQDRLNDVSMWSDNPYYESDASINMVESTLTTHVAYLDTLYEYTE